MFGIFKNKEKEAYKAKLLRAYEDFYIKRNRYPSIEDFKSILND